MTIISCLSVTSFHLNSLSFRCQLNNVHQTKIVELLVFASVESAPPNVVQAPMTASRVKSVIVESVKPSAVVGNSVEIQGFVSTGCANRVVTIAMTVPQMKSAPTTDAQVWNTRGAINVAFMTPSFILRSLQGQFSLRRMRSMRNLKP